LSKVLHRDEHEGCSFLSPAKVYYHARVYSPYTVYSYAIILCPRLSLQPCTVIYTSKHACQVSQKNRGSSMNRSFVSRRSSPRHESSETQNKQQNGQDPRSKIRDPRSLEDFRFCI
jgi:hypothetical protein